jgi:hypothetical protein
VGVFFFLSFLAYLHHYLRGAEGAEGWMASLAYGGGLVAAGVMLISAAIRLAATVVSDYGQDPQVAKTFVLLDWDYAGILGPAFAALLVGTSAIGLRFRAIPGSLAWAGAGLAVLLAFSGFYGGSLVAVSVLWILALAVALLRRTSQAANSEPSDPQDRTSDPSPAAAFRTPLVLVATDGLMSQSTPAFVTQTVPISCAAGWRPRQLGPRPDW